MGKSTVENDLTISGPEDDLKAFAAWVNSQTNDQAPSAPWAALYNLELEAKKLTVEDVQTWINRHVYEGAPDHGYGIARFKVHSIRIELNFPSKRDPCLGIVLVMSRQFPTLSFHVVFDDYDSGNSGEAHFSEGKLDSFEVEEGPISEEPDWGDSEEDSDW